MGGNLVYQAETSLITGMYGDQIAAKKALQRELEKKRVEPVVWATKKLRELSARLAPLVVQQALPFGLGVRVR